MLTLVMSLVAVFELTIAIVFVIHLMKMVNILKEKGSPNRLFPAFYYSDFVGLIKSEDNSTKKAYYKRILKIQIRALLIFMAFHIVSIPLLVWISVGWN